MQTCSFIQRHFVYSYFFCLFQRIAYNNLGSAEAKSICNALLKNMKVKMLDLSGMNRNVR